MSPRLETGYGTRNESAVRQVLDGTTSFHAVRVGLAAQLDSRAVAKAKLLREFLAPDCREDY